MKKLLLLSAIALTACSNSNVSGVAPPDLTFQHVRSVNIPVSDLTIERAAPSQSNAPGFVVPFEDKIEPYFRKKVQVVGGEKRMKVIIEESYVKESFEPSANKVAGFFDMAGFDVYNLSLILNVRSEDNFGGHKGVRLKLARTIKVSEHASVAEREMKQTEGVEALFRELDVNMTRIALQELDLIPFQGSASAPVSSGGGYNSYDSGAYGGSGNYNSNSALGGGSSANTSPRVITGGPSTGGGSMLDDGYPSAPAPTGANNGAIVRQEL
ncbi:MAG TPA: hypothetical protein PLO23_05645 [Alphaproteobacteria bacterium]|nr:hypothetical protein [Alphaproteobacteria bacterium]